MEYHFTRKPFTDWKIIIHSRSNEANPEVKEIHGPGDFEELECFFRTGRAQGQECEMFTIMPRDTEFAVLWLHLFKNGDVEAVSQIPSAVRTDHRNKTVYIDILVYCGQVKPVEYV